MNSNLPTAFNQVIHRPFGERGQQWLSDLPYLLTDCAKRWSLTLQHHFPNLSFNYVTPVIRADGTDAVLKAGVPCTELRLEMDALRHLKADGLVGLLECDSENGLLLLERLKPGIPLTTLATDENDERATAIAISVMRKLHRPAPENHDFPTVSDWGEGFGRLRTRFGGTDPLPAWLVEEAESLYADLTRSMSTLVLLHGDLHHDNILSSGGDGWVAIDPKGVIGEPAYEACALLRNLWEDRHVIASPKRILKHRVFQIAEGLGENPARIRGWGVAQAVLSAWWCIEDNSDCWKGAIEIAELLAAVEV